MSNPMTEHQVETYKSLITISLEGFKFLLLINGGAAVALLSYLAATVKEGITHPDLRGPMACFLIGISSCGLAVLFAYLTQSRLFQEEMGRAKCGGHRIPQYLAAIAYAIGLGCFIAGCWSGINTI